MTFVKHELKQGKVSFLIWTISIGFLLAVCVFLFPEMKGQMDGISETFASMGSFTAAFGMDRLDFGSARDLLIKAQEDAEEQWLKEEAENAI